MLSERERERERETVSAVRGFGGLGLVPTDSKKVRERRKQRENTKKIS